jgi:hypothetical protein
LNGERVFVKWASKQDQFNFENSLERGKIITVKYQGTNIHGTLLNPIYMRIREDETWRNLQLQHENKPKQKFT